MGMTQSLHLSPLQLEAVITLLVTSKIGLHQCYTMRMHNIITVLCLVPITEVMYVSSIIIVSHHLYSRAIAVLVSVGD